MSTVGRHDPRLYGRAGVADGLDANAPLRISEKPHEHKSVTETECYDCGNLIAKGEPIIISALECTQRTKARTHRYNIHLACYEVIGRVVALLGKEATHGFDGRPNLRDLWKRHHAAIEKGDKALHAMLLKGLGAP